MWNQVITRIDDKEHQKARLAILYTEWGAPKVAHTILDLPRKDSRILAALSASPGKLNPCAKDLVSFWILVDESLANAVA